MGWLDSVLTTAVDLSLLVCGGLTLLWPNWSR